LQLPQWAWHSLALGPLDPSNLAWKLITGTPLEVPMAAENPIQPEMTPESANHVIVSGHGGNGRTAGALAVVAGKIAPPTAG
jgi:hypothetical protein